MWAVDNSEPTWPVAHIYRLNNEVKASEPEIRYAHSSADFVLVSACIDVNEQVSQAITIAKGKKEHQLAIAVLITVRDCAVDLSSLGGLRPNFDTVFVVDPDEAENVVTRLTTALITPGSAFQPACCDWNDLRTIVSGHTLQGRDTSNVLSRYGFGRANGEDGAQQAMHAALRGMETKHFPNASTNRIVCLVRGPKNLRGSMIKQAMAVLHTTISPECWIARGIEFNDDLPEDTIEVDLFAFGGTSQ